MKFLMNCMMMTGLILLLAVPGVVGQTVTANDLNQVTQGFQTDVSKLTKAVLDLRAGQNAQNESIDELCEEPVEILPVPEEPESGVHVDAADEESVVNVVASNASDLVKVTAGKGAKVSVVIGGQGTSQSSEEGSSATTNEEILPTARPVVEQEAYFPGGSNPSQEQSAYSAAEADSESESASGAMSDSYAGAAVIVNNNVSANFGSEIPVIDATSGVDDSNAPKSWSWDGVGVQITYLQHPQAVETLSRGSLGLVSYPISSDVQQNIAYDRVVMGDSGSQIVLPTADGNIAVFQNGWVVYDNPTSALSAISQGRQVVGIERHL